VFLGCMGILIVRFSFEEGVFYRFWEDFSQKILN